MAFDPKGPWTAPGGATFLSGLTQGLAGGINRGMAFRQRQNEYDGMMRHRQAAMAQSQLNSDRQYGLGVARHNLGVANHGLNRSRVELEGARFEDSQQTAFMKRRDALVGKMSKALDMGNADLRAQGMIGGTEELRRRIESLRSLPEAEFRAGVKEVTALMAEKIPAIGEAYQRRQNARDAKRNAATSKNAQVLGDALIRAEVNRAKGAATTKRPTGFKGVIDDATKPPEQKMTEGVANKYMGDIATLRVNAGQSTSAEELDDLRENAGNTAARKNGFSSYEEMKAAFDNDDPRGEAGMLELQELLNQAGLGWGE